MNKSWNTVFLAGLFEIGWVVGLKHANSIFTWILTAVAIYASMHLLIIASRKLPVGTAYAVFAGMARQEQSYWKLSSLVNPSVLLKFSSS